VQLSKNTLVSGLVAKSPNRWPSGPRFLEKQTFPYTSPLTKAHNTEENHCSDLLLTQEPVPNSNKPQLKGADSDTDAWVCAASAQKGNKNARIYTWLSLSNQNI